VIDRPGAPRCVLVFGEECREKVRVSEIMAGFGRSNSLSINTGGGGGLLYVFMHQLLLLQLPSLLAHMKESSFY
jgi:hypothetical protein